jgi:hypothetical protein
MDIDGIDATGVSNKDLIELKELGAENLKRIHVFSELQSTQRMTNFMEIKTIWHPIGI